MKLKVKDYSTQSSLVSSIIFFIIGGILLTNADDIKRILFLGIGILLATIAVIALVIFSLSRKKENPNKKALIYGIFLLVLAVIFIFFSSLVDSFIKYVVGGWILFSGIIRLINSLSMSFKNNKFLPLLIVSILLIVVGIYTIVADFINGVLETVGVIMMIYSGIEIVGYIIYTKDKQEKEQEGTTSIIVNDKEESKEKKAKHKIKDVNDENIK